MELDCTHKGRNFHLLGYGFDHTRKEFAQIEQEILDQEKTAAREKIRLFQSATGIPVDEGEVMAAAADGVVPGELIAEILLSKKRLDNMNCSAPICPAEQKRYAECAVLLGFFSQKENPLTCLSAIYPWLMRYR